MSIILLTIHALLCIALVVLVLLQHGKGADIGANLTSGASTTVFGSHGPTSFLVRVTVVLAIGFFLTSLTLGDAMKTSQNKHWVQKLSRNSSPVSG